MPQWWRGSVALQYIPRNMHTVFALLCFVVVIHWLIFPYPPGLLHWHCGNLTIAPVPAKQPWSIWINTSCEFIINDCITTTKQITTKPCAYFLGYTVSRNERHSKGSHSIHTYFNSNRRFIRQQRTVSSLSLGAGIYSIEAVGSLIVARGESMFWSIIHDGNYPGTSTDWIV